MRGLALVAILVLLGIRAVSAGLAGSNHGDELLLRWLDRAPARADAAECERLLSRLERVRSPRVRREVVARLESRNSQCKPADHTRTDVAVPGVQTRALAAVGTLSMLVVRVEPDGSSGLPSLSASFVSRVGAKVREFFEEVSGGTHLVTTQLLEETVHVSAFAMVGGQGSDYVCSGVGYVPDQMAIAAAARAAIGADVYASFERVVYALPQCRHLPFAGSGMIPGKQVWINGMEDDVETFSAVLAHELGHNLGAEHAEHEELEYGNSFSVMGSAHRLPAGHFCASAKVHFGWIDAASQVVEFESPHVAPEGRRCTPGRCRESGSVWLSAHDGGVYAAGATYGLRVFTVDENEYLWVEFRSHYFAESLQTGALMTWVYEEPGSSTFGPTQLVDFLSTTASQDDASVPVGRSYTYDMGRTGVVVSVLEASASRDAILVHVEFVDPEEPAGLERLECDTAQPVSKNSLLRLQLDHPAELVFELSCEGGKGITEANAGIFVYPRYPLHHFLPDGFNGSQAAVVPNSAAASAVRFPGAGASFWTGFLTGCDAARCSVRASFEPHFSGEWAVIPNVELNGHPAYALDSQFNMVFLPSQALPGGGTRNVWVVTSQLVARPTAWYAFMVPSAQGRATELGSVGSAVEVAKYYSVDGWTDASEAPSFACSSQREVAHLSDLFTSAQGAVAYHEFTHDNYVLVHGMPSGMGLTIDVQCTTKHCAAGSYFDADASDCARCPAGSTSAADSQDADACYEACDSIVIGALDESLGFLAPDGLYVRDIVVSGAPSFVSYDGNLALYLLNNKWVLGPFAGSTRWYKTLSTHDAASIPHHPVAAAASFDALSVGCSCHPLPSCAVCATGALPDPMDPEKCFVPCRSLRIASAGRTFLDGTYVFAGLHNGKPRFASSNRELWPSQYGSWFLGNDHTDSRYFLLQESAAFWPVGMTPNEWHQGQSSDVVTITCEIEDEGRLSWDELLPDLAIDTTLTEVPTASPAFSLTAKPTKRPTSKPISSPTKGPTTKPTIAVTARPTKRPTSLSRPTKGPTTRPTIAVSSPEDGNTRGGDRQRGVVEEEEEEEEETKGEEKDGDGEDADKAGDDSQSTEAGELTPFTGSRSGNDGKFTSTRGTGLTAALAVGSVGVVGLALAAAFIVTKRKRREARANNTRALVARAAQHTMQFYANPLHAQAFP